MPRPDSYRLVTPFPNRARASRIAVVLVLLMVAGVSQAAGERSPARGMAGLPAAVMVKPATPVMEVARIDRAARQRIEAAAKQIDRLVASHWKEHGVTPSPPLSDAQFVRRVHLGIGGRIPSYDEVVAFLESKEKGKRTKLVEDLLESPDYVSHFYNYWADILRLTERPQKQLPFEPYLHYVKEAIRTNRRFDTWVHEMLTADGRIFENPAVGFQLRDAGMPLPYVDNAVRVLLGTQIGCAQCHDHPFDHWTQHQFYELAAFTSGLRTGPGQPQPAGRKGRDPGASAVRRLMMEVRQRNDKKDNLLVQYIKANATSVSFRDVKLLLPHDYQYADAEAKSPVMPQVLWGDVPTAARDADGRGRFAAWIVSRDNRQFARTIANRLWKKVMGVGLVEPVDDFREENPPSHAVLLETLTDLMLALEFDLREFVRVLVSTDLYGRRAIVYDPMDGPSFRFAGPALGRMTAEQLWDSILMLVVRNPWSSQRPTAREFSEAFAVDLAHSNLDGVERQFETWRESYGPGRRQKQLQAVCGFRGQPLVRASEMPTPLPLGHFLRQFGQSDRETIEGGRTVATVPQILAMFNGPITHAMLVPGSVIYDNVTSRRAEEAIDVVFLSVLSRKPSAEDRRLAQDEITSAGPPATGFGNLIWALLNTREFLFIQ